MEVFLISGDQKFRQNEKITLNRGTSYITTRVSVRSGKWYYEFTHYSGSQRHLIGFRSAKGTIDYYPIGNKDKPSIWAERSFSAPLERNYSSLPFSTDVEHTIGVGIDLDSNTFFVFYKHFYSSYSYAPQPKNEYIQANIWGANLESTSDIVSVNFGATPFIYKIPGFNPWNSNPKQLSCKRNDPSRIRFMIPFFVALLWVHSTK